ncbi:MAG TPA: YihY/virulence factor BrkB family protein [Candidatus Krumholzibacteria bacterium]|nr:YihY/virulence factor BrkB family protein [Candidatus Krumholzibacteria bacterium]
MSKMRFLKKWWLFLVRLQREMAYDDCMGMAAQIAFYAMLGLFPFMIFLLSIVSAFPLGEQLQPALLEALKDQMPLEAANYVAEVVMNLLPTTNQGVRSLGLLASLWGASMAIGALITTINRAYNVRPRRNMATQKLLAILLTLALSGLWLMAMTIILTGPDATQNIFEYMGIASETNTFWTSVRLPMAFVLNLLALSLLYYIAPEVKQKFRWILPGAVTSTLLWMGASQAFREFISRFGTYNKTYGSLAALVILMMWLWISGLVFLLGAEINSLMKRMETDDQPERFRPLR